MYFEKQHFETDRQACRSSRQACGAGRQHLRRDLEDRQKRRQGGGVGKVRICLLPHEQQVDSQEFQRVHPLLLRSGLHSG